MNSLHTFLVHAFTDPLTILIAAWIGSSAVRALPDPAPTSGSVYKFLFAFAHLLGANWDKANSVTQSFRLPQKVD